MNPKFRLDYENPETFAGRALYRIIALRDFGHVNKGDIGGFVEKEENLSHYGDCWIFDEARAIDNSRIEENAMIFNYSRVHGNAKLCGNVDMFDDAIVAGNAEVSGNVRLADSVYIGDDAKIEYHSNLSLEINGYAEILKDAVIKDNRDWLTFECWWFEYRPHITWTRSNNLYKYGYSIYTESELIEFFMLVLPLRKYLKELKCLVEYVKSINKDY